MNPLSRSICGTTPSPAKVLGTELATGTYRLLIEALGNAATLRRGSRGAQRCGRSEASHRGALIATFGGGTHEIQRDISGTVALRLPRAHR